MFKLFKKSVLAICLITLFGCSAMNPKAIDSVQSVAFVGFDIDANPAGFPAPADGTPLARTLQNTVKQSFSRQLGWNITKSEELTRNSLYQGFFNDYKSLFIQGGLVEDGQLRKAEADRLGFQERERLMNALEVDALAMIRLSMLNREVQNSNEKTTKYYDVMVNFTLYKKGIENTIWQTNTTKAASKIPLEYNRAQTHTTKITPDLTNAIESMDVNNMFATIQASEDQSSLSVHEGSAEIKAKKQEILEDGIASVFRKLIREYQNTPKK